MSGRRSRTVGENDEPQRVRSFQTTRSDSKYFDALPWSAFDNAAPDEVLEQQLSLLEKTDGSNVNSAFLYGNKPSWGWDYVFTFKMPRSLRRCLSSTSSDGSEGSATEKSPVCKAYDPDAVGDNDVEEAADKDKEQVGERVRILARLKSAGFVFSQLLIPSENIILLRFSLPENRLKEKAGKLGIELKLKEQFGGGYMAYSSEREHYFMNDILGKARNSFFCPADRALIILNVLQSKENWGCNLNMEKLLYDKTILQAFALHSEHEHGKLIRDAVWKRWWDPTWKPPLAEMKDYLGARVTFYFVFVSFYARRLLLIALASIPVYVTYRVVKNIIAITILRWLFSISLVLWTTFFLENWKRRNAYINIEWGLNDYKEDMADNTRAQYEGELRYGFYCEGGFVPLCDLSEANSNARTDGMLQHASIRVPEKEEELLLPQNAYSDPMQVRNMKLQSVAVTAFFVILVGSLTFLLLWFRNEVVAYFEPRTGKTFANAFPGILNGILITAFDSIWRIVSLTLTRRENHRTNQEFENSLIYKRFAFQFVSNYISLFYIAFIRPYINNTCPATVTTTRDPCMRELETQLTSLVITKATIGQLTEIGIPFITNKVRTWHARQKSKSLPSPRRSPQEGTARRKAIFSSGHNRYVRECKLGRYDSTMEDYGELVIQFGYLVLFGVAFPLASVVNLVNNIIEVRTDALKILKLSQRTDADDAADIGAWYPILEFLNVLAVATNVGLLVFTADSIEILFNLSERLNGDTAREWLVKTVCFFSVEHVLLGGKGLAAALVKDVPGRTHRILARQMYDIARWFDLGWREGFRGGGLLRVDERQVELCGKYAEVFEVASEDERM